MIFRRVEVRRALFVCLLGTAAPAWAQAIHFEHLTTASGLSQMTVYGIAQDERGFMWFATQDGLNRYDGHRFRVFRHQHDDPDSLSHSFVRALLADPRGGLWVGTYGGGLNHLDPAGETFRRFQFAADDLTSLGNDDVRALALDRDGALWVGTRGGGLSRLAPGSETFERFRHDPDDAGSLSHDDVRALHVGPSGTLWVGTYGGGINRWDPASRSFVRLRAAPEELPNGRQDEVRALLEEASGTLWVGTNGGLYRRDPATGKLAIQRLRGGPLGPMGERVRSLYQDAAGLLWVGTRGEGLHRVDVDSGEVEGYAHDRDIEWSLSRDSVYSVHQDRSGGIWVGTYDGGVNWFDPRLARFTHFEHDPDDPASLSANDVNAIEGDGTGAIWIGTFGGGLDRFDSGAATFRNFSHDAADPGSLGHDDVRAIHLDRRGELWIGSFRGGLDRYLRDSESFEHYRHDPDDPASLSYDDVYALHGERSGDLWVGTYGGGLNRLDIESGEFTRYLHDPLDPTSIGGNDIGAILEDRAGVLWVATRGGRLSRFDRDSKTFDHYQSATGDATSLSHSDVSALFEDRAGNLWIGTFGGGLDRLSRDRETFDHFVADELAGGAIHDMLEDAGGRLWISTNRGLWRFDPRSRRWSSYDRRDGLQDEQYNPGAAYRAPDGRMYFGGIRGFNVFDPGRFEENSFVPPVVLTSFRLFEQESTPALASDAPPIELAHDENFFTFEFAALSYRRPDKNRYRYRLENFDAEWIDPGARRSASYTNVPPGSYVFRVRASNNDGLWNEVGAAVAVEIRPPWWGAWWLRLLALAAFAALLLAAHRVQVGRKMREEKLSAQRQRARERERLIAELESKNAELESFAHAVTHDLKSPLITLSGFVRFLEQDSEAGDRQRVSRDIEMIRGAVARMQTLVDDLLSLSRAGRSVGERVWVPMTDVAYEAIAAVAGRLTEAGVAIQLAPDLPTVCADPPRLQEVLQNLLENAAKYTGEQRQPTVEIGWREEVRGRVFFVRDNGMGVPPEHHERVFGLFNRLVSEPSGSGVGLALVQRVIEAHGGEVWVESEGAGRGSTFCFTLPDDGC